MWLNLNHVISVLEGVILDWIALLTGRLWPETREPHYQKLFENRGGTREIIGGGDWGHDRRVPVRNHWWGEVGEVRVKNQTQANRLPRRWECSPSCRECFEMVFIEIGGQEQNFFSKTWGGCQRE